MRAYRSVRRTGSQPGSSRAFDPLSGRTDARE